MVVIGEMLTQPVPVIHSVILLPSFFLAGKHPLSFHVNGTLAVGIGGVKPLDLSFLGARDLDGDAEELWFHMDSAPSNGRLVMAVHGKEVQLSKGDRFSCKDVKEKKVRFVHSKEKSRCDSGETFFRALAFKKTKDVS